jgi:hypothetical protein
MEATAKPSTLFELDHRSADGLEVSLWWSAEEDQTFVFVDDAHTGQTFRIAVEGSDALDAFEHPYAYAAPDAQDAAG